MARRRHIAITILVERLPPEEEDPEAEARARFIAERLFNLAATAALARSAPAEIAESYALTRLAAPSRMIGANDLGRAVNPLLERAFVAI